MQALRLSSEVYGGYVKVEEYSHGHHMKVVYWRPGSDQLLSAFLLDTSESESCDYYVTIPLIMWFVFVHTRTASSWPKLIISVDPLQSERPFLTIHNPPLPEGSKVTLSASNLSLELLLKQCVLIRSRAYLREMKTTLNGTGWHKHGRWTVIITLCPTTLPPPPLSLSLSLSLSLLSVKGCVWKEYIHLFVLLL